MNKSARNAVIAVVLVAFLAACALFARGRVHFDFANLKLQMRAISWGRVAIGVALIWLSVAIRAPRWRVLLGSASTTGWAKLLGPQFVGFTVIALFGRAADLARPYLTARRTGSPVATQLAVYFIERALDLGSAAILFSIALALAPKNMPHHEEFKKAGQGALVLMAAIVVFLLAVRFAGAAVAAFARKTIRIGSKTLAESVAAKILEFREGLRTIRSFGQFGTALILSLLIWAMIAGSYFETTRAFRDSAQLASFSVPQTMLLLASSMAGSLIQLPVLGWFSQIGVLAGAYIAFFSVPVEIASAAGAILMAVTTLGIVPAGLIAARIEGVSLRDAARSSEAISAT